MYEEIVIGIVLVDLATTLAGTVAVWKKINNIDHRLTILETKYCIEVTGGTNV